MADIQCYICDTRFEDNHKLWQHIRADNCEKVHARNVLAPIDITESTSMDLSVLNTRSTDLKEICPTATTSTDKLIQLENHSNACIKDVKLTDAPYCQTCDIRTSSALAFNEHVIGKRHLKNIKRRFEKEVTTSRHLSPAPSAASDAVSLVSMASTSLSNQSQQPNHKLEVAAQSPTLSPAVKKVKHTKHYCDICEITTPTLAIHETHLKGKRHAFRLTKSRREIKPEAPTGNSVPFESIASGVSASSSPGSSVSRVYGRMPSVSSLPLLTEAIPNNPYYVGRGSSTSKPPQPDLTSALHQLCLTQILSLLHKIYPTSHRDSKQQVSSAINNSSSPMECRLVDLIQKISQDVCCNLNHSAMSSECIHKRSEENLGESSVTVTSNDMMHNLMLLCWCQQLSTLRQQQHPTGDS